MGSSGLGSSWYPTVSRISTVCMKYTDTVIAVQSSEGSFENIDLMKKGKYDMGIAESNVMVYGFQGKGQFSGSPYPGMRFVTSLYPVVFQAVVRRDSGISNIYEIKGKKFSSVTPGLGEGGAWQEIFETAYGFRKEDLLWKPFSNEERRLAFMDGIVDSVGFEGSCPSGSVLETSAQTAIRILPVGGKERKTLMDKYGWFKAWTIAPGTYPGQSEAIETVAIDGVIIADAKISEKVVYDLVSSMYGAGLDTVRSVHEMSSYIRLENALSGAGPVPLHPGAERFYREKGLLK